MKYRALLLAVFAAVGICLTACTSSEEIAQDVRSESYGNGGAGDSGSADGAAQPGVSQNAGGDAGTSDVPQGSDAGGGTTDASGDGTQDAAAGSSQTETGAAEETRTETPADSAGDKAAEDIWSGTYASEQETVTISLIDAESFSFAFTNSGIASVAEVDGDTAVYRGDDHHNVVFGMNEGVLNITVSSEEDYDASASPLNGTYIRMN